MGGSFHIHGTGSSFVDTVFVCRSCGSDRSGQTFKDLAGLETIVRDELAQLRAAGMKPTVGDIRCIVFGHLTQMAVSRLRKRWNKELSTANKLAIFARTIAEAGDIQTLIDALALPVNPSSEPKTAPPLFA
jgi:hypothetical protein